MSLVLTSRQLATSPLSDSGLRIDCRRSSNGNRTYVRPLFRENVEDESSLIVPSVVGATPRGCPQVQDIGGIGCELRGMMTVWT